MRAVILGLEFGHLKAIQRIPSRIGAKAGCSPARQQQRHQVRGALKPVVQQVVGLEGSGANQWRDASEKATRSREENH